MRETPAILSLRSQPLHGFAIAQDPSLRATRATQTVDPGVSFLARRVSAWWLRSNVASGAGMFLEETNTPSARTQTAPQRRVDLDACWGDCIAPFRRRSESWAIGQGASAVTARIVTLTLVRGSRPSMGFGTMNPNRFSAPLPVYSMIEAGSWTKPINTPCRSAM